MPGINEIASKAWNKANGVGFVNNVMKSADSIFSNATQKSIDDSRGILGVISKMRSGPGRNPKDFQSAVQDAFSKDTVDGATNWGTVAGSYIGASAAYRGLSGGGAYRDSSGNPNVIGVPFV